jgi:hypothetical protein
MSIIKIDKKNLFIINETFFNKDGGINIKLMKNVFKETYIKYENNIQRSSLSLKKKKKSRNPISVSRSRSKSILKRKTKNKSLF